MPPVATAEKPPEGLDAYWLGVWRHALKALKAQGSWEWEQKPLLDEYVFALIAARDARTGFRWLDALEEYAENSQDLPPIAWSVLREIAGGLPSRWDRHTKRASALADQLLLTARGRKAAGFVSDIEDEPADPFAGLDAEDELAKRRSA